MLNANQIAMAASNTPSEMATTPLVGFFQKRRLKGFADFLASVDENFINGGIRGENDARGWFLLRYAPIGFL